MSQTTLPLAGRTLNEAIPEPLARESGEVVGDATATPTVLLANNELLRSRLGVAASLFAALRYRHGATAAHSLRVTLTTAAWSLHMGLAPEQSDLVEVAALLHDLGKIGVPDQILLKPGPLTPTEMAVMRRHRLQAAEILRGSVQTAAVLEIISAAPAWFDGSFVELPLRGEQIPLGARMLAIVDAFDAMTHAQPYRAAMSPLEAQAELERGAGTQFDPILVALFIVFVSEDPSRLHVEVVRRWMEAAPRNVGIWRPLLSGTSTAEDLQALFRHRLVDNMRDAAIFVDPQMRVLSWNPGAERMTGIPANEILGKTFVPSLVDMRNDAGTIVLNDESPIDEAVQMGEQRLRRLIIRGRGGADVNIEAHVIPVAGTDGCTVGAAVLLHDVSPELSLEARCQNLQEMATRDPLTQLANRAEFNRVHQMFVSAHLSRQCPCTLIITDIDHFKQVNDTYGHLAGDEVLKSYARLLRSSCRSGDLVARYGGEEFVLLCVNTDRNVAAQRAETIRVQLSQIAHPMLGMRTVTASFGVTEIQADDTPASMLARADRALYQAKDSGRNCVVTLGVGLLPQPGNGGDRFTADSPCILRQTLLTPEPLSIIVEKLRGFISDKKAKVVRVHEGVMRLQLGSGWFFRRSADRACPMFIDLKFTEVDNRASEKVGGALPVGTRIEVQISLQRVRDRRRRSIMESARNLLASLRSYLIVVDDCLP